jgi:hypothetical protein
MFFLGVALETGATSHEISFDGLEFSADSIA